MFWSDQSYYRGEWKKGIQHGIGELYVPGKNSLRGAFENNIFVREDLKRWRELKKLHNIKDRVRILPRVSTMKP